MSTVQKARWQSRREDVRRVVVEDVDLQAQGFPVAVCRDQNGGGLIRVDLSMAPGGSETVTPRVGETWWVKRQIGRSWHLGWKEDAAAARAGGAPKRVHGAGRTRGNDDDFPSPPEDGVSLVVHNDTTGKSYISWRDGGSWYGVEGTL